MENLIDNITEKIIECKEDIVYIGVNKLQLDFLKNYLKSNLLKLHDKETIEELSKSKLMFFGYPVLIDEELKDFVVYTKQNP